MRSPLRSATAIIRRSGAIICRPIIAATVRATASSRPCISRPNGTAPMLWARRAGSKKSTGSTACRALASATRSSIGRTSSRSSPSTRDAGWCAASATSPRPRAIRARPGAASPARWTIRAGGRALPCSSAADSPTTCRPPGGTSAPQPSSRPIFPRPRSSSTTPAFPPTAVRKRSRAGAARSKPSRRSSTSRSKFPASAARACPGRSRRTGRSSATDGFLAAVAEYSPEDQRKLFHDNATRIYRLDRGG